MSLEDTDLLDGDSNSSDAGDILSMEGLAVLPLTILAVYTVMEKAAVLSALTAMFGGAAGVATIVTTALWVAGVVVIGFIGLIAVWTAWAIIAALVTQRPIPIIVSILGIVYFGVSGAIAHFVFGGFPFLVGFVLASNLLVYGLVVVVGGITVMAAIVLA